MEVGQTVNMVVLRGSSAKGRSIMEILDSGPERHPFQTAEEVRANLAEGTLSLERSSFVRGKIEIVDRELVVVANRQAREDNTILR